jgi:hypothetical protein
MGEVEEAVERWLLEKYVAAHLTVEGVEFHDLGLSAYVYDEEGELSGDEEVVLDEV